MPREQVFREIARLGAVEAVVEFQATEGEVAIERVWLRLLEGDREGSDAPPELVMALVEPVHQEWGWDDADICAEGSVTWEVKEEQVVFSGREKRWEDVDKEAL